jgi:hypothetical protein
VRTPKDTPTEHVHRFQRDSLGDDEMVCACGAWQCKHRDGRSKKRCKEAAENIQDFCSKHRKDAKKVEDA